MKKIKVMYGLLAMVLTASVFTGCGSNNNKSAFKDKLNKSEVESAAESEVKNEFKLSYETLDGFIEKGEQKTEVPNGYRGIYSVDDLKLMSKYQKDKFILMADLDISDVEFDDVYFKGIFDGNYHQLSGGTSYIITDLEGTVRNLALVDVNAKNAALINRMTSGTVENCYVTGVVDGYAGLINAVTVSNSKVFISKCYNQAKISEGNNARSSYDEAVGGVIGTVCSESAHYEPEINIENCWNYGEISISGNKFAKYAGGVIGYIQTSRGTDGYIGESQLNLTVSKCFNYGNVKATKYGGGIVGNLYAENASESLKNIYNIEQCANYGKIEGVEGSGGICGGVDTLVNKNGSWLLHVNFSDCLNTAEILCGEESSYRGGGVLGNNQVLNDSSYGGYVSIARCINIGNTANACGKSSSIDEALYSCSDYYTKNNLSIDEMKDIANNLSGFSTDIWGISDEFAGFPHPYGCIELEAMANAKEDRKNEEVADMVENNDNEEIIRNQRYTDVLASISLGGKWPDSGDAGSSSTSYLSEWNSGGGTNYFSIVDINNDKKEELVVHTYITQYVAYSYDAENDTVTKIDEKEDSEGEAEFFKAYPAVQNCDWKELKYENYSAYTQAYIQYCITNIEKDYNETDDIGLAYLKKNGDISQWVTFMQEQKSATFTSDDMCYYGNIDGQDSIGAYTEDGGSIYYQNNAIEGVTLLGITPGMSLNEAEKKLEKYGFRKYETEYSTTYITGGNSNNLFVYFETDNGKVTKITLMFGGLYVG